jgi:hypothetical protein
MKKIMFLAFSIMAMATASAQKMKVESGSFDFLKGQSELNVVLDFDKATFYNEKMTEEEYIAKRKSEITKDKGASEASSWEKDWKASKSGSFKDKFILSFNKNIDSGVKLAENTSAKYTVIVETTWIYPGWFAGVMKQPAKISTRLKFIETGKPGNVLLVIASENAPGDVGMVGVANNNDRMAEGYAKTGKSLAKLINKKMK